MPEKINVWAGIVGKHLIHLAMLQNNVPTLILQIHKFQGTRYGCARWRTATLPNQCPAVPGPIIPK